MASPSNIKDRINPKYPDIPYLRAKAKKRIPGFAFDYLDGGCNAEINLDRNTREIREEQMIPYYLRGTKDIDMRVEVFGERYDAPFGVSPIGLQGLMWPGATEILAKAAHEHNLPFILSTVGTASLEKVAELTHGKAWFQLYHPVENELRDDLLNRCEAAGYPVFVVLADVPSFGYRSKEIKNGLAIPPRMTLRNIRQIMSRPNWALSTLFHGQPNFATLKPYIPEGMSLKHLGLFMNKTFNGRLSEDRLKEIRDKWKGKLVIKGAASVEDVEKAHRIGLDGVLVSNHGGRQLDQGESAIGSFKAIHKEFAGKIELMMDSGVRTGPDIATVLANGASMAFLGRSFMYGVSALGKTGGDHTMALLKTQLLQVMQQVGAEKPQDLMGCLKG
jgi:L-lactate dehydrogenase (cytochrome)